MRMQRSARISTQLAFHHRSRLLHPARAKQADRIVDRFVALVIDRESHCVGALERGNRLVVVRLLAEGNPEIDRRRRALRVAFHGHARYPLRPVGMAELDVAGDEIRERVRVVGLELEHPLEFEPTRGWTLLTSQGDCQARSAWTSRSAPARPPCASSHCLFVGAEPEACPAELRVELAVARATGVFELRQ